MFIISSHDRRVLINNRALEVVNSVTDVYNSVQF
jgi:hypothetical protein